MTGSAGRTVAAVLLAPPPESSADDLQKRLKLPFWKDTQEVRAVRCCLALQGSLALSGNSFLTSPKPSDAGRMCHLSDCSGD